MPQPPATLTLRYCATCGRDDLRSSVPAAHYEWDGGMPTGEWCPGTVQTLTYRLAPSGQPERDDRIRDGQTRVIVERLRSQQRATESVQGLDTAAELIEHWFLDNRAAPQPEPQYEYRAVLERENAAPYRSVPQLEESARAFAANLQRDVPHGKTHVERRTVPGSWERLDVPDTGGPAS